MSTVLWRKHPLGFKANNIGHVVGKSGRMVGYLRTDGYRELNLSKGSYLMHVIIWEAFNGKVPTGFEINHIDMDKSNNRLDNLEMLTHKENLRHAYRVGLKDKNRGELNPRARLKESDVQRIRDLYCRKVFNQSELARQHDVSHRTISLVVNRKIWKNVPDIETKRLEEKQVQ